MPSTIQRRLSGSGARTSSMCETAIDKLAYVLPSVEKSVSNDAPPPDVVAEWSGSTSGKDKLAG